MPSFTNYDWLLVGVLLRKFLALWVRVFIPVFFFSASQFRVAYKFPVHLFLLPLRTLCRRLTLPPRVFFRPCQEPEGDFVGTPPPPRPQTATPTCKTSALPEFIKVWFGGQEEQPQFQKLKVACS